MLHNQRDRFFDAVEESEGVIADALTGIGILAEGIDTVVNISVEALTRQKDELGGAIADAANLRHQLDTRDGAFKTLEAKAANLTRELREAQEGISTRDAKIARLNSEKSETAKLVLDDMLKTHLDWEPVKKDGKTPVSESSVQPMRSNVKSFLEWYLADKLKPITPDNAEAETRQLNLLD